MVNIYHNYTLWNVELKLCDNFINMTTLHSQPKDLSKLMDYILDNIMNDIKIIYLNDDIKVRSFAKLHIMNSFIEILKNLNNCYNTILIRRVKHLNVLRRTNNSYFTLIITISSLIELSKYLEIDDRDLFDNDIIVNTNTTLLADFINKLCENLQCCRFDTLNINVSVDNYTISIIPSEFLINKKEKIKHLKLPGLQMVRRLRNYTQLSYFSSRNPQQGICTTLRFI